MYTIYTVNSDVTVEFAAQELKKYLRMMMPRAGEIPVAYNPDAKDGFRLGLMTDFGMTPDVKNPELDDVIYVKTDKDGGIIAGSNPRSVLLSVYRYLKLNGCIWLFPGPDGERIPTVDGLKPVDYTHTPPLRFRGQATEGSVSRYQMSNAIAFTPKVGMNAFMIEQDVPSAFYNHFYRHIMDDYEDEGPVDLETILQWKRSCEAEFELRDLMFHDVGHGWNCNPFGWAQCKDMTEEQKKEEYKKDKYRHAAMIGGERKLFGDRRINTNFCMSNPETRKLATDYICNHALKHDNVDYLHVWLADATNNHCECEECAKKTPSDWYVVWMNEVDSALTKLGLKTRIVFICYVDTFWAPITERIANPDRFSLLFAPIKRKYTETYGADPDMSSLRPYERNKLDLPRNMSENMAYLKQWQKVWSGDTLCFEYYFWRANFFDMGSMMLAKTIYEDAVSQTKQGLAGILADGSQRPFFPTGFQFYVYGEAMYDPSRSYDELKEEYFSQAFGKDWQKVVDYLESISTPEMFLFLSGHNSSDISKGDRYNPSLVPDFESVIDKVEAFMPVIESHMQEPDRAQYVSWDVLRWHANFLKLYAKGAALKAAGDDEAAFEVYGQLRKVMPDLEYIRHDCYDNFSCLNALKAVFKIRK